MHKSIVEDKQQIITYDLFSSANISQSQYHTAFEITKNHLQEIINFAEMKYEDIIKNRQGYINSFDDDFQCFEEMSRCIELIKNRKNQELDCVNHYDTLISGWIKTLQSKKESLANSEDFNKLISDEEQKIIEMIELMNKIVNDATESDLKTTYNTLLKSKDDIEISVMVNLCSLLTHTTSINPKTVEKMLRHFNDLKATMMNFTRSNLSKEDIIAIGNKIKLSVSKIDPNRSEDRILCTKYSHLLVFGLWGIAASEMSLHKIIKEELIIKAKKFSEEIIPIDIEIDQLENLKSRLSISNDCINENNELDSILTQFEEIKTSILDFARIHLPEEIENKRMYFSKINSILLMEEDSIPDLYSAFRTLSNDKSKISIESLKNIRNYNKPYRYLQGMCGFLNCFRHK